VVKPSTQLVAQPNVVLADLEAKSAEGAIVTLHNQLSLATPAVKDRPAFLTALLQRARVSSVALAPDVAIPHARTDAVDRLVLAVGRSRTGIAFDAEHPHVRLVFLIGTPRQQIAEYLELVAGISRLLRREGTKAALLAAPGEDELRAILSRTINMAA